MQRLAVAKDDLRLNRRGYLDALSNFDILINIVAHEVILSDLLLSHYISSR
jgi:hypothetical protein